MSCTYTKIKYATEGSYGNTEYKTMYLKRNNTCDIYTLYNSDMQAVIYFDEWLCNNEDFIPRLYELATNIPKEDNNVEYCTEEEIAKLKKK